MTRILVVDDDAAQLELRCQLLAVGGYAAIPAFSPSEAMRQLITVDLILMDLRFPNEQGADDPAEGLALIRRIHESDKRVPIIVLSGWPQVLDGQPEAGMVFRVLSKPVGMDALLQAIKEVINANAARGVAN